MDSGTKLGTTTQTKVRITKMLIEISILVYFNIFVYFMTHSIYAIHSKLESHVLCEVFSTSAPSQHHHCQNSNM